MQLSIVVYCAFLVLPVNGSVWINYLLALTSDYLHAAKIGMSYEQAYKVAIPVIRRANKHCVTGHASDIRPEFIEGVQTLLKPCGFLSNRQLHLTTSTRYVGQYNIILKNLASFHFNVSFTSISLLFSLDECMVESIRLIDSYNKTHLRVCGKLMPGDVQFKTCALGVVFRKHVWSNSSFFLFYHVIDNSSRSAHASMFYPVHVLLTPYNRPIQVLEDFITCSYNTITYVKLMIHEAMKITSGRHDPRCTYIMYDGPTRHYPELIPNIHSVYGEWFYQNHLAQP